MSSTIRNLTICVRRGGPAGLADAVSVESEVDVSALKPNEVLLLIDKFGFSANNVTYGMLGENKYFRYFDFFPAPETEKTSPKTHAIIPVWGFGTVVASAHSTVSVGRRVHGYLSMSSYVVMQLDDQRSKYTIDVALNGMLEDRRPYRQLTFCDTDALYRPDREDEMMLYQPLFWTAYWMEDSLNVTNCRGLKNILISSASSKTAFIVAYRILLRRQAPGGNRNLKLVGLTSGSNLEFTRRLGFYDQVFAYDQVASISKVAKVDNCLYIDVSGDRSLNDNIARNNAPKLTIQLGMTNVQGGNAGSVSGAKGNTDKWEFFFMPEWLAVRVKQVGPKSLKGMQKVAWDQMMEDCPSWVKIETYDGEREVLEAYLKTLKGDASPDEGQVFTLRDKGTSKYAAKL